MAMLERAAHRAWPQNWALSAAQPKSAHGVLPEGQFGTYRISRLLDAKSDQPVRL
ncbi:MAG TPA: hypothetical protein VIM47_03730 [Dermatophilaceae bacterium]|jgi:hypothetical protein